MVVPPGDSIQTDFLHSAYKKIYVFADHLSVFQDSNTWTPLMQPLGKLAV